MKWTPSGVNTTMAELPVKLVKYRIFGSDVTTSASSPRAAQSSRTARCRRLSASVGACDMDIVQPALQGGNRADRPSGLVHSDLRTGIRGRHSVTRGVLAG